MGSSETQNTHFNFLVNIRIKLIFQVVIPGNYPFLIPQKLEEMKNLKLGSIAVKI